LNGYSGSERVSVSSSYPLSYSRYPDYNGFREAGDGRLAGASCLQAAYAFSLGIDAEAGRPGRTILQIVRYPHDLRGASCLQAASAFSLGIDAEAGGADDFANRPLSARLAGASCLQAASAFSLGIDAEASENALEDRQENV